MKKGAVPFERKIFNERKGGRGVPVRRYTRHYEKDRLRVAVHVVGHYDIGCHCAAPSLRWVQAAWGEPLVSWSGESRSQIAVETLDPLRPGVVSSD